MRERLMNGSEAIDGEERKGMRLTGFGRSVAVRRARAAGYVEYAVLAAVAMVVAVGVTSFGQTLIQVFERIATGVAAIR